MEKLESLREKAEIIYLDNFGNTTNFERAVFFSWYCDIGDCKYCYMSTVPKDKTPKNARRTKESILAEIYLTRKLGWDFGFLSGGHNAFKNDEFVELIKYGSMIFGDKLWINVGPLSEEELVKFKPYIKGVVGAIETINPELHDDVCPSKPISEMADMLSAALKNGILTGITIILGLGEKKEDYGLLKDFIDKYKVSKIHYYGLNPQKGTEFENAETPSKEYQAWWIAKTRIDFPKIDIQAGIWLNRTEIVGYLINSGANSVSKYPALKAFGKKESIELERQFELAGRKSKGTLTKLPEIDYDSDSKEWDMPDELKVKIKEKVEMYLKGLRKHSQ